MKILTIIFFTVLSVVTTVNSSNAQGVDDLINQFGALLHPSSDASNSSLTYTQDYLNLKSKVDALSADNKTAFQNGIQKYSSDPGYTDLNNMIFGETTGTSSDVAIGKDASTDATVAKGNAPDSSMTVEVFDRRHKLLKSYHLVPTDLDAKMKADGYDVTLTSIDISKQTATINYGKADGSSTVKVSFPITGDCDVKYKIAEGPSVAIHAASGVSPTVKVTKAKK